MPDAVVMQINPEDVKNLLRLLSPDLARKALRSAVDRTATWAKNYIADDVSKNYNLTSSRIKRATTVKRSTQNALSASVKVSGAQLSILDDFKAIQDASGIKATISRTQQYSVPHAFINVTRNSGKRVIMKRAGKSRYPTTGKPGRGPSIPTLANRLKSRGKRDSDMLNHFYIELENQIATRTSNLFAPSAMID